MTIAPDPLHTIASPPPHFPADEILEVVQDEYGLDGELVPLVSERDQNFRLTAKKGCRYVVKIANAAEDRQVTDFQVEALQHLERKACSVAVPVVFYSRSGHATTPVARAGRQHTLRVVSYLPGRPLEDVTLNTDMAFQLGSCLAAIDVALRDFEHPGDSQSLLWDMRFAGELRNLVSHIPDVRLRGTISACLDDYSSNASPRIATLRSQVIHNDLNPGNILVATQTPASIAGVIDFGDMIRAPLIFDAAVAAAYLRSDDEDTMSLLASFVAGYDAVTRLDDIELELLYDLVRTRLATTITILHWRMASRAEDDAYTAKSLQGGASAGRFLDRLNAISRSEFTTRLQQSCDH